MESVDCMMGLEMDDDKLNGKSDSRHNARNIHVGFPNFPLFLLPLGFFPDAKPFRFVLGGSWVLVSRSLASRVDISGFGWALCRGVSQQLFSEEDDEIKNSY